MLTDKQILAIDRVLELYIDGDYEYRKKIIEKVCNEIGRDKAFAFVGICLDIHFDKIGGNNKDWWNGNTLGRYFLDIYKILEKYGNDTRN